MTKFEFLGDLSRLIADLPPEEVEQAMEYYEDYFADAGPEKEQEIIKDFISPAYIAEQLREASLERQKAAAQSSFREEEQRANAAAAAAAAAKPPVFSRKLAAQAQKGVSPAAPVQAAPGQQAGQPMAQAVPGQQAGQPMVSAAPVQAAPAGQPMAQAAPGQQAGQPMAQAVPGQQAGQPMAQAAPGQQAGQPMAQAAPGQQAVPAGQPAPAEKKSSNMRNSIFRDDSEEDKEKAEKELELKNRTKVDIKSINATTSKVDKKQARAAAKRSAAEEKAFNAERYSSSKKMVIGIVLLITCPIWLAIVGVILGLFVVAAGLVVGCAVGGIGCFLASIVSVFLTVLALVNAQIPTSIFALGCVFFLLAAGAALLFGSFKLATRGIPSGYFNAQALFKSTKSKISRLALK